jgi:hypothetical protein
MAHDCKGGGKKGRLYALPIAGIKAGITTVLNQFIVINPVPQRIMLKL